MEHEEPETGNDRCDKNNWMIQHQNSFKDSPDDTQHPNGDSDKNQDLDKNHNSTSSDSPSMELEEALGYLASRKLWHFLIFLAIATFDIPFAFNLMSPVFLVGANTDKDNQPCHLCLGNDDVTINPLNRTHVVDDLYTVSADQCYFTSGGRDQAVSGNVTWQPCTNFEIICSEPYGKTVVSEFFLVCENSRWAEFSNSLFYLGVLLGSFFTNLVSDMFGRKWVVLGGLFVQASIGVAMGFLPSFPVFVAGRFVQGLIAKAVGYVSYVMCLEFLPIKLRTFYGVLYNVVWVTGYCLVGIFAYLCHDWRKLTITMSGLLILFAGHCWFLPESPQFYVASNKIDKARKIILQGARVNRLEFNFRLRPSIEANSNEAVGVRIYTPLDLVRTPRMRLYFFMVSWLWFVNNLGYYMLSLASTRWGGNIYVSYCLGGVVELPAYVVSFILAEKFGRKWTLITSEWILAVLCVVLGYFNSCLPVSYSWAVIAVGISCKFFVGITFSLLLLIGTEVFPTVVRGIAVGACTLLGDFGSVISPIFFFMDQIYEPLPYILVGVASALGGASVLLIAETWHRPLPVTIHDTEILHTKAAVPQQEISESKFISQSTTGHNNKTTTNNNKNINRDNNDLNDKVIVLKGDESVEHSPCIDAANQEKSRKDIKCSVESSV